MKTLLTFALAAAALGTAHASPELAQKRNCLACHAKDTKVIGPAYKDVAAKYAGQPEAVNMLAEKIRKGGVGVWGQVPMPENAKVTEAEAKKLAAWVLSLK